MKTASKYLRLMFEGTLFLAIILYFFGPLVNGYYSSKRIGLLWLVFMAVLFVCAKKIIVKRDRISVKKEITGFVGFLDISRKDWIAVFVIFTVAFLLRIINIDWNDAFHIFHPDEGRIVEPALEMTMSWLDLYSDHFVYPGQFLSKFVAIILIVATKVSHLEDNVMLAYTVFRCLNSFAGALTVFPAYFIGEKIWKKHGWILAVATALFPSFLRFSVQVTGDISGLFFQLMVLLFSLYWINSKKKWPLVIMGLMAAASTMEKWHNGVICVYIAILVIVTDLKEKKISLLIKDAAVALLSWVLGLLIIAPNLLWHFNTVISEFLYVWNYDSGAERGGRWMDFVSNFFSYFGVFMLVIVILGIIYTGIKHEKDMCVILGGLCSYLIMNIIMNRLFERWGCLIYFTMLMFAFLGFRMLTEFVKKPGRVIALVLGIVFAISMITFDVKFTIWADACKNKDTRVVSEKLFEESGITTENTISGYYTTFAPGGRRLPEQATALAFMSDEDKPYVKSDGKLVLRDDSFKYLILSDYFSVSEYEPTSQDPIYVLESGYPDLWYCTCGDGSYKITEIHTIINTIENIKTIINAEYVGPTLKVYDISKGYWEL